MKGNYIAKNMNIVNRNSVHKNIKEELNLNNKFWINEEFKNDSLSFIEKEKVIQEEIKEYGKHNLKDCSTNINYIDDKWDG